MPAIELWLRQPAAQAIGWALLQFVWQGAVVGALAALALLALGRSAADIRYVVSSIALVLMLTLPVVTGVQRYQTMAGAAGAASVGPSDMVPTAGELPVTAEPTERSPRGVAADVDSPRTRPAFDRIPVIQADALLPIVMVLWLAGVSVLTVRLLTGWLWVQRLRTHGVAGAEATCLEMTARLARRLHIDRAITLLESTLVEVPTVIGFLKPVVLLPASAVAGLHPQQLEAVLAHELAHIRRHDYLVNLLQTLVETVLFYHPAVWWLSRRIRSERENCCDDLAVNLCGDPVAYAAALADLEALRAAGSLRVPPVAMAATRGPLLHRVRRLLGAPPSHAGHGPAWLAGAVALLLVGGVAAGAERGRQARVSFVPAVASGRRASVETEPARIAVDEDAVAGRAAAAARASEALPARAVAAGAPPPAAPAAAADAPVEAQSISISQSRDDSRGSWSWSNNGDHLEVTYSGTFEFTDDDTDVRALSSGGTLKISDGRWLGRHSVEIKEHDGALEHHYYVNAAERPFEPEGRAWLRENLPRFVRNTGLGAEARVARLLKSGGPAAVLSEIGRIDTSYAKRIYYTQLFKQASLTPEQYRQALVQAGREMRGSSYELAELLIGVSEQLPADAAARAAYFTAAASITSDYETRRVYSAILKRGPVPSATLGGILANARSIQSDYDQSELLRLILAQQSIDEPNRAAFFAAVGTIGSSYERHRVLSAVVNGQRPSDPAVLEAALAAATSLHSDYEASQFLQEALRQNAIEGSARPAFFAAVETIGSDYERGRVLQAVVRKAGTGSETLRAVLRSASAMHGYELSQLLQLMARTTTVSGDLRNAYVAAADRLDGYEQTQALAALARSERRQ